MDSTAAGHDQGAMAYTAYFSGVMQISQSLASVACPLLKREGEMKRRHWTEHPVYNILNSMANPWVNSLKWREACFMQKINWGNSYSYIQRDNYGRPTAVYLLDPARMRTEVKDSGEPVYIYRPKKGGERTLSYTEIFNLSGFGPDAYTGYSMISNFKEAVKLGLSQQSFSNSFIDKGVNSSGMLIHPETLSEKAKTNLKASFGGEYGGSGNAGRVIVLEEGMTYTPFSMSMADAEFLASRVFQLSEIARILNMPLHKLKDLTHATFSNIEHQQIEWITDTLRPDAERFERAVDTQLMSPIERKKGYAQHDMNQLQRGDMKTVMETQRIGRFAGLLSADQALFAIGMNPMEDEEIGKRVWQPSNMMNAASEAAKNGGGAAGGAGGESEIEQMV